MYGTDIGVERKQTHRRRVENNAYCVKIKGESDPARPSVADNLIELATRHTALRGQELYLGADKEQENQNKNDKQKCQESQREKAKSSKVLFWDG